MSRLDEEQKKELIKLYLSNNKESCKSIAERFGVSRFYVSNILKINNILIRKNNTYTQKFTCNESFFENIDNKEKAQILGLLYADGCNNKKYNSLHLSLIDSDFLYLENINNIIKNTRPLRFVNLKNKNLNWNNCYIMIIYSKKICQDLENLGCVPKKSLILKFPTINQLPEHLLRYFILGYFEGDGSLMFCKEKNVYGISICSTLEFCQELSNILKNKININCLIRHNKQTKSNNYTLSFGGNLQVLKFLNWIYKDCCFYMRRKYNTYLELKNLYFSSMTTNRAKILYEKRVKPYENI